MAASQDHDKLEEIVEEIVDLIKHLPATIPDATKDDKIYHVMTNVNEESAWATFNRRFDILFGEDCRDLNGRLHYVRRGRHGMAKVASYLSRVIMNEDTLKGFYGPAAVKLERLRTELKFLVLSESESRAAGSGTATNHTIEVIPLTVGSDGSVHTRVVGGKTGEGEAAATSADSTGRKAQLMKATGGTGSIRAGTVNAGLPNTTASARNAGPGPTKRKTGGTSSAQLLSEATIADDPHDKSYKGGANRAQSADPVPAYTVDEDGHDVVPDSNDEQPRRPTKRKYINVDSDSSGSSSLVVPSSDETSGSEPDDAASEVEAVAAAASAKSIEKGKKGKGSTAREKNKHWEPPRAMFDAKAGKRWTFKCKFCASTRSFERSVDSKDWADETKRPGLGNLSIHTTQKHKDEAEAAAAAAATSGGDASTDGPSASTGTGHGFTLASAKLMERYLEEGKLNPKLEPTQRGFLQVFAAWIIEDDLPWTTGESPGLARVFRYMQSKFLLPTDTTVRNAVASIFAQLHTAVVKELAAVKSRIAYSTDTWTTKQMVYTFAGTIACFIDDDWQLVERLIDFRHLLDDEHEGVNAAKAFMESGSKRALTMDNATTNDVLARTLSGLLMQRYGIHFSPENGQIRCLAHVVNLVVQKMLASLIDEDDPDDNDWYLLHKFLPFHYDIEDDDEVNAMEAAEAAETDNKAADLFPDEEKDEPIVTDSEKPLNAVDKLRLIVRKIVSSPQRRSSFRKHAQRHFKGKANPTAGKKPLSTLMPVRDVRTRWNCTHAMIERALLLRKAIVDWVAERDDLESLTLIPDDWALLQQLEKLLSAFTHVTHIMSKGGMPTLSWVLPMYHDMQAALTDTIMATTTLPALRNAARAGLTKLEEYYAKAKECQYNVIATMCHPCLRSKWFKKLGSLEKVKAEALFEHVFHEYEKKQPKKTDNQKQSQTAEVPDLFLDRLAAVSDDSEGELPVADPKSSEIARWLRFEGGKGHSYRPLDWWREHAQEFPVIAAMARDFLAIPGASVSVERLFSASRHLCADTRSSLKAETITEAMCAKRWLKDGLFNFINMKS
ncbi:hypothetical protein EVJ58_g10725 [Rhodofomes roseus]|uniref:HAT C-terminal dimerisation domain-containing protein n=1 Tax=Rhodofomes roseus TaxID=34475 RepID=A0A4Y9XMZ0_9APHY|nr:hypothetical protein EVJ58_g10725 [Rhodofomes roseus]